MDLFDGKKVIEVDSSATSIKKNKIEISEESFKLTILF